MSNVVIELPALHRGRNNSGGQLAVDQCPARFIICLCGRRWGKTHIGVYKCVKGALDVGGVYWWVGPTFPIAMLGWMLLKRLIKQIPGIIIRESERYVEFPNGSQIWIKSADNPDSLRGEGLSGVVFDEMAQITEVAWTEAIRPSLSDKKGWALFIGTPKGKNWIYRLWNMAGYSKDWARFRFPTSDNPYIDLEEIQAAKDLLSPNTFKQEYEADFGASQYLVFPTFDRQIHSWKWDLPKFTRFWGGLDFGDASVTAHKSSSVIAGITEKDQLLFLAEFEQSGPNIGERQLSWMSLAEQKIKQVAQYTKSNPRDIFWKADATQMWGIQLARSMGHNISKSRLGKDVREQRVELAQRRLMVRADGQPKLFYLPHLRYIPEAFERYRYPDPTDEDKEQKMGPLRINDDTMSAVLYLIEGVDKATIGDPHEMYQNQLAEIR